MPKIKRDAPISSEWKKLQEISGWVGEKNDCGVKAIAIATGADYGTVRVLMRKHGRKDGSGSPIEAMQATIRELGFECELYDFDQIIARYPAPHNKLRSVTTHHPVRFAKVWPKGTFLLFSRGHVACIKDGVTHDWSQGRALRSQQMWKIVKA